MQKNQKTSKLVIETIVQENGLSDSGEDFQIFAIPNFYGYVQEALNQNEDKPPSYSQQQYKDIKEFTQNVDVSLLQKKMNDFNSESEFEFSEQNFSHVGPE
ncbi:UNKNOWN [Stylonychia lemnae]|uniref:Uncharacterized protein n=1 Tax=Stylonychia lemnae TaxID=5949 RepID=A0A078AV04_STYLE|nr:UNKNOWN [Stylonychia lemnae]|eukprot:CDW84698.1 UNKNOWN [Stylonychia lemnae]